MRRLSLVLVVLFFFFQINTAQEPTEGSLFAFDENGSQLGYSPLEHTDVMVRITGFLARVTVEQQFGNNFDRPIEALYTFPLSNKGAVDRMEMKIGERVIRGKIKRREEAKAIYDAAKKAGKRAALLDQQRPNVFRQSVANILPGEKISVTISYVERLEFKNGSYEFVFPMVVAPRYTPTAGSGAPSEAVNPKIITRRSGRDISIKVELDAGTAIENIESPIHEVTTQNLSANSASITLANLNEVPNRDFVLRYDVTGKRITDSLLTEKHGNGGFFLLHMTPPDEFKIEDVSPKEIVFVLDTSGSMGGFPIEKAKEAMLLSIDGLYPNDRLNVITFAGDTEILFESPVPASEANVAKARQFLSSRKGDGGTEMMQAIEAAFKGSESQSHLRIVCFMTDGLIGNESNILAVIKKNPNARVFSFGIGNSPNRYLLDEMAKEGRGEAEYVTLADDGSEAAKRFHERIRNPIMTDVSVDWSNLPVSDIYPKRSPDLFDSKPVVAFGRHVIPAAGTIKLKGNTGQLPIERDLDVRFPDKPAEPEAVESDNVIASLWARARIEDLNSQRLVLDQDKQKPLIEEITQLGLEFGLTTEFTSFVAVEEKISNVDGKLVTVEVPVRLADGTFGQDLTTAEQLGLSSRPTGSLGVPTSNSVHGFITQLSIGRRSNNAQQTMNRPAAIVGLDLTVNRTEPAASAPNSLNTEGSNGSKATEDGPMIVAVGKILETHYKNLQSFKAVYSLTEWDNALGDESTKTGEIRYAKGAEDSRFFRFDSENPSETLVIANGKYTLLRKRLRRGVTGELEDTTHKSLVEFLNPAGQDLENKYKIVFLAIETIDGRETWHLKLTPKTEEVGSMKDIQVWFDTSGMIRQLKITQGNDDSILLRLSEIEKNVQLSASDFKLNPKGFTIIKN